MKQYLLKGDPIALARPRLHLKRVFDCQRNLKINTRIDLDRQHEGLPFFTGPIHIDVVFVIKIPDKIAVKERQHRLGRPHTFRPDLDNLIKYILDVCAGIIYKEDSIVSSITAKKIYGTEAYTQFSFREL